MTILDIVVQFHQVSIAIILTQRKGKELPWPIPFQMVGRNNVVNEINI